MGFEPEVLAQAALWAIAGGARSKAAAITGRCIVGARGLGKRRAGNERDQRESSDKRFHDASPCARTIVRGFLQQRQAGLARLWLFRRSPTLSAAATP
jgi:hypothetical protein